MSDKTNAERTRRRPGVIGLAIAVGWLVLTPLALLATVAPEARAQAPGTAAFRGLGLAFGVNANGEVGDGTTVDRATPVAVNLPRRARSTAWR